MAPGIQTHCILIRTEQSSSSDLQIYARIEVKQLRFNAQLEFINLKLAVL